MYVHRLQPPRPRSSRRVTDRVQRLKEARTEATKEIEEYRKLKEDEFKAFEASVRCPRRSQSALPS